MKRLALSMRLSLVIGIATIASTSKAGAQQRDSSASVTAVNAAVTTPAIASATMDSFAAANMFIAELRARVQAELAEPKAKKADTQAQLREKLQAGTARVLKEHNLTEAEFTSLTHRVSTDDTARRQFDEALARLPKR